MLKENFIDKATERCFEQIEKRAYRLIIIYQQNLLNK